MIFAPSRVAALFAAAVTAAVGAQPLPLLEGEFWIELEPAVRFEQRDSGDPGEQVEIVLEEARFVFSGMIYGFAFRYVPLDLRRGIAEEFELLPLAEIRWGDPRLAVTESRRQNGRRYLFIRYGITGEQASWSRFWASNIHAVSGAYGEASIFSGQEQKMEAIREALKESVRDYLRTRIYNKPREIAGRIAFREVPYVVIDDGNYRARIESTLDIRTVTPYQSY